MNTSKKNIHNFENEINKQFGDYIGNIWDTKGNPKLRDDNHELLISCNYIKSFSINNKTKFYNDYNTNDNLCFYEIINYPKANIKFVPYLDIEFYSDDDNKYNSDIDKNIQSGFKKLIKEFCNQKLNLKPKIKITSAHGVDKNHFKYSYHFVIRDCGYFDNIVHAHLFAANLNDFAQNEGKLKNNIFSKYFKTTFHDNCGKIMTDEKLKPTLPIDGSVYKNGRQVMRCILSNKNGKDNSIVIRPLIPLTTAPSVQKKNKSTWIWEYFITDIRNEIPFDFTKLKVENIAGFTYVKREGKSVVMNIDSATIHEIFSTEGAKDLKPLPKAHTIVFYLSCLPNLDIHHDIWYRIGAAIFASGGCVEEFIEWSKKSQKFDEDYTHKIFASFKPRDKGYNFNTLVKLAHKCRPDLVGEVEYPKYNTDNFITDTIDKYCDMDDESGNIKMVKYAQNFVIDKSKPVKSLSKDYQFVLIKSPMGTGKSFALRHEFIYNNLDKSILILVSRRTYGHNITADVNSQITNKKYKFKNYLDYCFLNNIDHLVIQLESLHKIERNYDIIIIDECESLFAICNSMTLHGKIMKTFSTFYRLLNNSKHSIFCDAFLGYYLFAFLSNLFSREELKHKCIMYNNEYLPPPIYFHNYSNIDNGKDIFTSKIVSELNANKKVILFSNSKIFTDKFIRDIIPKINRKIAYKYYYGGGDEYIFKDELANVKVHWSNIDLLVYTPTITIGVDYNIPDVFDTKFVYICNKSCTIRDVIQATMRVRNTKSDIQHVFIDYKFPSGECLTKYDDVIYKEFYTKHLIMDNEHLIKDKTKLQGMSRQQYINWLSSNNSDKLTRAVFNLRVFGILEKNRTEAYPHHIFADFAKKLNWKIIDAPITQNHTTIPLSINNDFDEFENVLHLDIVWNYHNGGKYNWLKSVIQKPLTIKEYIDRGDNSRYELLQYMLWDFSYKYYRMMFNKLSRPILDKNSIRDDFTNKIEYAVIFLDEDFNPFNHSIHREQLDIYRRNKKLFNNAFVEKTFTPKELAEKSDDNTINPSTHAIQLKYILYINKVLGTSHSCNNGFIITYDKIPKIVDCISKHKNDISNPFEYRCRSKNNNWNTILTFINGIYGKWTGSKIIKKICDNHKQIIRDCKNIKCKSGKFDELCKTCVNAYKCSHKITDKKTGKRIDTNSFIIASNINYKLFRKRGVAPISLKYNELLV